MHFFALCGVLVSLHAALERTKFQLFEKAARRGPRTRKSPAEIYDAKRNEEERTKATHKAVVAALAGDRERLKMWHNLKRQMTIDAKGPLYRHLVGHNSVQLEIEHQEVALPDLPPHLPAGVGKRVADIGPPKIKLKVSQAAHGRRKRAISAEMSDLTAACEQLQELHKDLDAFLAGL